MKALVIGATGLVGRHLVNALLADPDFDSVHLFTRRDPGISHPKAIIHQIDFERISDWSPLLSGDVLFSALGTTISAAGSKDAFFQLDHDTNLAVAQAAADHGVSRYLLVSSQGASPRSPFFYLRTKGLLEAAIRELSIPSIILFRPSLLVGKRDAFRFAERLSAPILRTLSRLPGFRRLRPVPGEHLARVMKRQALVTDTGVRILASCEILESPTE